MPRKPSALSAAPETPSQAAIARALGLSKAAVTKCKARGMPTHSAQAAREWRKVNVKAYMRWRTPEQEAQAAVEHANALALAAAAALEAGRFAAVEPELRQALREVPNSHAGRVVMPLVVWDALTVNIRRLLAEDMRRTGFVEEDREGTDEEIEFAGVFAMAAARGWVRVVSENPLRLTYRTG